MKIWVNIFAPKTNKLQLISFHNTNFFHTVTFELDRCKRKCTYRRFLARRCSLMQLRQRWQRGEIIFLTLSFCKTREHCLSTNSETAATTPLRVVPNFQRTLTRWILLDRFNLALPHHMKTSGYVFVVVVFCSLYWYWRGYFLSYDCSWNFQRPLCLLIVDTNSWLQMVRQPLFLIRPWEMGMLS